MEQKRQPSDKNREKMKQFTANDKLNCNVDEQISDYKENKEEEEIRSQTMSPNNFALGIKINVKIYQIMYFLLYEYIYFLMQMIVMMMIY